MIDTPYNRKIVQKVFKMNQNALNFEKAHGLDMKELKYASNNSVPYTEAQIDRSYGYGVEYEGSGMAGGMASGDIVEEVKKYIRKPRTLKQKMDEQAGMEIKSVARALKSKGRPKKKLDEKVGMELKTIEKAIKTRGRPKKVDGGNMLERKIGAGSKSRKALQKKLDKVLEVKEPKDGGAKKNKIDEIISKIEGKGKEEKEVEGGVQILKKGGALSLGRIRENLNVIKEPKKKSGGIKLIPKGELSGTNMIGGKKTNPWLEHVKQLKQEHKGKPLKEILKIAKDTYNK